MSNTDCSDQYSGKGCGCHLSMVYSELQYWVSALWPVSGNIKTTTFVSVSVLTCEVLVLTLLGPF